MSSNPAPAIILFHYHYSPYAHKISWYLHLRSIPYKQCLQPPIMPRPDLSSLGITYRRIPILSIGNDVLCDTALIIRELEARFPAGRLGEAGGWEEWEEWSDGVFPVAVRLVPSGLPLMRDPRFIKDREDYNGQKVEADSGRGEAMEKIRSFFDHIETRVLSDGRNWILGEKMSLADLQAVWPLEWLTTLPGALDSTITPQTFPRAFSWISRFAALLPTRNSVKVPTIKGPEAKQIILEHTTTSTLPTGDTDIGAPENNDPSDIACGKDVEVVPVDTGRNHPQRGTVVASSTTKIVLEVTTVEEHAWEKGGSLRVVFPRRGYEARGVGVKGGARL